MMSLWDALRMNMMISYQELVRTFLRMLTFFGYTIQIMQINISEYNIFIAPIIHPGR